MIHNVTSSKHAVSIPGLGRRWIASCTNCAWSVRLVERLERDRLAFDHHVNGGD